MMSKVLTKEKVTIEVLEPLTEVVETIERAKTEAKSFVILTDSITGTKLAISLTDITQVSE